MIQTMNPEQQTIALITGAGSPTGIGFAVARALGRAGHRIAVTSMTARIEERAAFQNVTLVPEMHAHKVWEYGADGKTRWEYDANKDGQPDLAGDFDTWADCERALRPPDVGGLRPDDLRQRLRAGHPGWSEAAI